MSTLLSHKLQNGPTFPYIVLQFNVTDVIVKDVLSGS